MQYKMQSRIDLLLVCVLTVVSVRGIDPTKSCAKTRSIFESITVLDQNGGTRGLVGTVFDDLRQVTTSNECPISETCCSSTAESSFKEYVTGHYKGKVLEKLSDPLMDCHNHSFLDDFKDYIENNRLNVISNMRAVYGIYFLPYVNIFDKFYAYLQSTVDYGNTCNLAQEWNEVLYEVYLAAFFGHPRTRQPAQFPDTQAFRECFFNIYLEDRSDFISTSLNGFLRSYTYTMRYFRALKTLNKVVTSTVDYALSEECQSSIMKMTHCSSCASLLAPPCEKLCLNVLRGCLVDLSDMFEPLDEFGEALIELQQSLSERNGVRYLWGAFSFLESNFYSMISTTFDQAPAIQEKLLLRCDANGARSKRQAPGGGAARVPRSQVQAPMSAFNHSSHCITEALNSLKRLPELICDSEPTETGTCWTGRALGSYGRTVLDFDRGSQRNNPEMTVGKNGPSHFRQQIANLKAATREIKILTGSYECGVDDEDEDCTVPETCDYYDIVDAPTTAPEPEEEISGSGSGSSTPDPAVETTNPESTTEQTEPSTTVATEVTTRVSPTGPGGDTTDDDIETGPTGVFTDDTSTNDPAIVEGQGTTGQVGPGGPGAIGGINNNDTDGATRVLSSTVVFLLAALCVLFL